MSWIVALGCLLVTTSVLASEGDEASSKIVDYGQYSHKIELREMRAGIHDASGTNQYYFQVIAKAAPMKEEEKTDAIGNVKPDAKKPEETAKELPKEVTKDLGTFAAMKIEALAIWKKNKESPIQDSLEVTGDHLRHLVSLAMQTYQIPESKVNLWVDIVMYEKNSWFGLVGEDTKIHTFLYHPLRPSEKKLHYRNSNGTHVRFGLSYKSAELAGG